MLHVSSTGWEGRWGGCPLTAVGALPLRHVPSNNPSDQSVAECSGQGVPGSPDHPRMTETPHFICY